MKKLSIGDYRVCINKSTGKIIEMQSGGKSGDTALNATRLDTLKTNALNAGYIAECIELKWLTGDEYQALLAASIPPVRITSLSMRQARLQLLAMGLLSQVETAVQAAGEAAGIEWEYAATVERDNALFRSISAALSLTDAQEEQFFVEGSLL